MVSEGPLQVAAAEQYRLGDLNRRQFALPWNCFIKVLNHWCLSRHCTLCYAGNNVVHLCNANHSDQNYAIGFISHFLPKRRSGKNILRLWHSVSHLDSIPNVVTVTEWKAMLTLWPCVLQALSLSFPSEVFVLKLFGFRSVADIKGEHVVEEIIILHLHPQARKGCVCLKCHLLPD